MNCSDINNSVSPALETVEGVKHSRLVHPDWAPDVKAGLNALLDACGIDSPNYRKDSYAVFDFDDTCSIFDVENQTNLHQILTMSFAMNPSEFEEIMKAGLTDLDAERTVEGLGSGSYRERIADITGAYTILYDKYGPFTHEGVDKGILDTLHADPLWMEFASKLRVMGDLLCVTEPVCVGYPWILYWFTGMTEEQVYSLAAESHRHYSTVETSLLRLKSPGQPEALSGDVDCLWPMGIAVSENIRELWRALKDNGIDIWVCSASAPSVIRAGIDVFGLHEFCRGVLTMTPAMDANGKYLSRYDYEGCGWYALPDGQWQRMERPEKAQTWGPGKVTAITSAIAPEYNGHGPLAAFGDSNGDFNFCTEFETLKAVVCFNRADRRVTDGGGLMAEVAIYERDFMGYDFTEAEKAGDTLYLLQGHNDNGERRFLSSNETVFVGESEPRLFADDCNAKQLLYMEEHKMSVAEALNRFAVKTSAEAPDNSLGFAFGFFEEYSGYHTHK